MGGIPAGRSSVLLESFKVLLSRLFIHRIDMAFFSINHQSRLIPIVPSFRSPDRHEILSLLLDGQNGITAPLNPTSSVLPNS